MGELVAVDEFLTAGPAAASGRAVAIARRIAISGGKAALPPPENRVRDGKRSAAMPEAAAAAVPAPASPPAAAAVSAPPPPAMVPPASTLSGRDISIERRRLLAGGKAALKAAISLAPGGVPLPAATEVSPPAAVMSSTHLASTSTAHDVARQRRAAMALSGRGSAPPAPPSRPARSGSLDYAPKVTASETQSGQTVTGLRIGQGRRMTGDERGFGKPVSGTQYLSAEDGASFRAPSPKVGMARTERGQVVTGTLVRSRVLITGDEAGQKTAITGKADQLPDHDLTPRKDAGAFTAAQFGRQANPHGATVFGTNLGRSMKSPGSRERNRSIAIEATDRGFSITGSAVGRSTRVTGDENGACRTVTGTQYLAPAWRQAACGYQGGGTAPREQIGRDRADPVTVNKVTVAESWGGQRVTGPDIEHNRRVTGDEPGSCAVVTGSQYQGPVTGEGWCDTGAEMGRRLLHRPADAPVTGDTPVHAAAVTGTARGAGRDITGTPYYRDENGTVEPPGDPLAAIDSRFSIRTPQRSAQLFAAQSCAAAPAPKSAKRVTGSFAVGDGKITGNVEFLARSRSGGERKPAHAGVTGEGGATLAKRITGDSWAENPRVTGQEDAFAAERNPTERGPKARAFAGNRIFRELATHEEPRQLVTGMMGYFNKTGARVTLSGGAQS
ncbi:MAG: hypothetical protein JOZ42_10735 [Acetobacteraceae bacterium]|nr:hypothetical protein [Acetobacteraceae bacterium]